MTEIKHYPTDDNVGGIPYFNNVNVNLYFTDKGKKCKFPSCENTGISGCYSNECRYIFCDTHYKHDHHQCREKNCKEYATAFSLSAWSVCCDKHYREWYRSCKTCHKQLTKERVNIGFCLKCNALWQSLRSKGVDGPFGKGVTTK